MTEGRCAHVHGRPPATAFGPARPLRLLIGALLPPIAISSSGCARPSDAPPPIRDGTIQVLGPNDVLLLDDAIGSVAEESTGTGAARASFAAYPYGPARYDTATVTRKYANAPRDESVGLDSMGVRTYAPDLGTWTSVDVLRVEKPERGIRSSFAADHAYAYAALNPVLLTDPDGRTVEFDPRADASNNATTFSALQSLTRDTLAVRAGAVVIERELDATQVKERGTELIRRLVASERRIIVSPFVGKDELNESRTDPRNKLAVGTRTPTDAFIALDMRPLSLFTWQHDGTLQATNTPLSIVLGHELIHADRMTQGTSLAFDALTTERYTFGARPVLYTERVEELLVMGLQPAPFLRAQFGTVSPVTENNLRAEQGLPLRAAVPPADFDPMRLPGAMPAP